MLGGNKILRVSFSGGLPDHVETFADPQACRDRYDELVAIDLGLVDEAGPPPAVLLGLASRPTLAQFVDALVGTGTWPPLQPWQRSVIERMIEQDIKPMPHRAERFYREKP